MENARPIKALCVALFILSVSSSASAQGVYLPDTNFRAWLSGVAPGAVDVNGYLDTTHTALNIGGAFFLSVTWPNSDLTGLEYLNANEAYIEYWDTTGAAPLSALPDVQSLGLYNMPMPTLPPLSAGLMNLYLEHCPALTALPSLPAGLVSLGLNGAPALNALPALPNSLLALSLRSAPLLTTVPALPGALESLELREIPALSQLPNLPSGALALALEDLPLLTTLPALPSVLEQLTISDCPLMAATITVPGSARRVVLSHLPQATAMMAGDPLDELVLDSLMNVDLSGLLAYSMVSTLRDLPNLTVLPVLGPDTVTSFTWMDCRFQHHHNSRSRNTCIWPTCQPS